MVPISYEVSNKWQGNVTHSSQNLVAKAKPGTIAAADHFGCVDKASCGGSDHEKWR